MTQSNEKTEYQTRITDWLSCRKVLNILVILGFMLNYALRVNLTIAIVAMVQNITVSTTNDNLSIATTTTSNNISTVLSSGSLILSDSATTLTPNLSATTTNSVEVTREFNWDSYQQNFVLGCFFWGYILTELPGGRLAELIGGRRVFGHSMLWASLLTLVTPLAANTHYVMLIVVRVVLGFMLGASWPAIHPMAAVWIPPLDRSKFMSNMMASSLGAAITMPICGVLISSFGWSSVFYVTGGAGLIWSVLWFFLIYDTPASHPRISPEELKEIEDAIGTTTSKKRPSFVPWMDVLTSKAVWAIILTHGLSVFGYFTVINQLPTFMHDILHFDIKKNGLFSSLPYFAKYIMAVSSSFFADYLRRKGTLSTTAARKLFTSFALIIPGFVMIGQVFLGRDAGWSVANFTMALFIHGAVTAGYLGNGLDIAPNFSGTIFGMANTLSSLGGFLSSWMVGALTYEDKSYHSWQIVFWILAGTYISGALVYLALGSGKLQPWNNPQERKKMSEIDTEEGVPLKNTKVIQ